VRISIPIDVEEFEEVSFDDMMDRMNAAAREVGYGLRKNAGHPVGILSEIVVVPSIVSGRSPDEPPARYIAMSAEVYKL
jgi:hypothetical protein